MDILLHPTPELHAAVLLVIYRFFQEHAAEEGAPPLTHRYAGREGGRDTIVPPPPYCFCLFLNFSLQNLTPLLTPFFEIEQKD